MDGYITKPVNPKELLATIESQVRKPIADDRTPSANGELSAAGGQSETSGSPRADKNQPPPASAEPAAIDFAELLARVEDDSSLLEELIELYRESSPRLLSELEAGVEGATRSWFSVRPTRLKAPCKILAPPTVRKPHCNLKHLAALATWIPPSSRSQS